MKKFIFIGILFVVIATFQSVRGADLNTPIMVPATVGGYNTVDLLAYVAKLKAADDAKTGAAVPIVKPTKEELEAQYVKNNIKPVCVKGALSSLAIQLCQASVKQYNKDEAFWVNQQLSK